MSFVIYKALAGMLIFIISFFSVSYPLKLNTLPEHNRLLELADAFASGIFLGAALFHMLPDARESFALLIPGLHYPLAELVCAGGFLFLLMLECLSYRTASLPIIIAIIIIIHAFIEGAALGFNIDLASTLIIGAAILAHKGSESFSLAIVLKRAEMKLRLRNIIIGLFLIMTPLGILLGTSISFYLQQSLGLVFTAIFNAFAAGTFLFMSTIHHINHHTHEHDKEKFNEFFALMIGMIIMAVIAVWH